jgi:phytoene dehydrogenase-like protein
VARAVVVGAGANGLAAAIELARAGERVVVREAAPDIGGSARSAELTLPGFVHDVCSAGHPLGASSPFFRSLPLRAHGLEWFESPSCLAHPFDDGRVAMLDRSIESTAASLGRDGPRYRDLLEPFVERWDDLVREILAPLHVPRHPILLGRFGWHALRSARGLVERQFRDEPARALFLGIAAHASVGLTRLATASFGLVLAAAGHVVGWPGVVGGTQQLANALGRYLVSLGGRIIVEEPVRSLAEIGDAEMVMLDLTPRQVLAIAGDRLPASYRRALGRFRYGPGVFKMDWALSEPVPWRSEECRRALTVHLGGTLGEMVDVEDAVLDGRTPDRPFVLVIQPTLFDPTRAPAGKHTLWAYCHVPNGSTVDMTARIEAQLERFAPGFRDVVLARSVMGPAALERHNENLVGGDISGGAHDLGQLFFRPVMKRVPYATPVRGLYLCSSSTPPGAAVHGMCGYHAARAAIHGKR